MAWSNLCFVRILREQVCYDSTVNIGESEISSGMSEGELFVIDSQLMEDRGMEVVDFHRIFDGIFSDLIGSAMNMSCFESASGEPDTETVPMMASPVRSLAGRCTTEFGRPEHDGVLQHAALF